MMNASPIDRRSFRFSIAGVACAAILAVLPVGPVSAQTTLLSLNPAPGDSPQSDADSGGAPLQLLPNGDTNGAVGAGFNAAGTAPANTVDGTVSRTGSAARSSDFLIEETELRAPTPDSVGILDDATGGFDADIWQGGTRELMLMGLASLPDRMRSAHARDLAIRLLGSAAAAPLPALQRLAHAGASSERDSMDVMFSVEDHARPLALRIRALMGIGAFAEAADLAALAPADTASAELARAVHDAWLRAARYDSACHDAPRRADEAGSGASAATEGNSGGNSGDDYWQRLLVFCLLHEDDLAGAQFGTSLLADMGLENPGFFALTDHLVFGLEADVSRVEISDAINAALLQRAGLSLPADSLTATAHAAAAAAYLDIAPDKTAATRFLAMAETAARHGLIGPDRLARAYTAAPLDAALLDEPLTAAMQVSGPVGRALLYQSIAVQPVAAVRAELLSVALNLGIRDRFGVWTARVFRPFLDGLRPARDLAWFAGDAALAYYLLGSPEQARDWKGFLPAAPQENRQTRIAATLFSGFAAADDATDAPMPVPDHSLITGARLAESGAGDAAMVRAALALATLDGIVPDDALLLAGFDAPPTPAPTPIAGSPDAADGTTIHPPDARLLYGLRRAAALGRVGEGVLFALHIFAAAPPERIDPAILAEILGALQALGLEREARAIAVEAVMAATS